MAALARTNTTFVAPAPQGNRRTQHVSGIRPSPETSRFSLFRREPTPTSTLPTELLRSTHPFFSVRTIGKSPNSPRRKLKLNLKDNLSHPHRSNAPSRALLKLPSHTMTSNSLKRNSQKRPHKLNFSASSAAKMLRRSVCKKPSKTSTHKNSLSFPKRLIPSTINVRSSTLSFLSPLRQQMSMSSKRANKLSSSI